MALTKTTYSMLDGATVNVVDHGAIADWNGSTGTDNTAAFTAAIAALAANGGGTLLIPAGDYKGVLLINQSNIQVIGYGANIGFLPVETLTIKATGGTANLAPFLGFAVGSNTPLTPAPNAVFYNILTATQGSQIVTVTGAAGLSVGDYCMMTSGTFVISTPITNYIPETCQIRKVLRIVGDDIHFNEVNDATVTALSEHPYLIKWDFVENIRIEGLRFNNLYGAAYSTSFGGCVNLSFEQVSFEPESAWGAFASCRRVSFNNCTIKGNGYGFSNGRMCDEITFTNCTVSSILETGSTAHYYFLFCEENPKRVTIDNCSGVNGAVQFYGGGEWTCINISNSKFDVFQPGVSAFRLTTYSAGSRVNVTNSTFVSIGGDSTAPWEIAPNGVVEVAYLSGDIVFSGCAIIQAGVGIEIGNQHYASDNVALITPSNNETGSWTPTIYGLGTAGVQTYIVQSGFYARTGNLVTVEVDCQWSASTGAGNIVLSGLPFTSSINNTGLFGTYDTTSSLTSGAVGACITGTPRAIVYKSSTGPGSIVGQFSYFVD